MPWVKISVTVFKKTLGETTLKEDFICGDSREEVVEKGLAKELCVELVRVLKRYNRSLKGTKEEKGE